MCNKCKEIDPEQVLGRLRRCGVDISCFSDVVVALESEIHHYRDVIHRMGKRSIAEKRGLPAASSGYRAYGFDRCCGVIELEDKIGELNEFGCRIVAVTQAGEMYTVFYWGTVDG